MILFFMFFGLLMFFWLLTIYATIFRLEITKIFGLIFCYILLFPVFTRIYVFLMYDKLPLRNIYLSYLILFFLFLLLLFYLKKLFGKKKQENKFIVQFNKIQGNAIEQIFKFLFNFTKIHYLFMDTLIFLSSKINTNNKKLIFYAILNLIPKALFFSALFWDINITQELYYSLRFSLFLIFPIIFNLSLNILETFCNFSMDMLLCDFFFFLDPDSEGKDIKISLKRPCKPIITQKWIDVVPNLFERYCEWIHWCTQMKEVIEKINTKATLIFLCIQILCQICSIIQQVSY